MFLTGCLVDFSVQKWSHTERHTLGKSEIRPESQPRLQPANCRVTLYDLETMVLLMKPNNHICLFCISITLLTHARDLSHKLPRQVFPVLLMCLLKSTTSLLSRLKGGRDEVGNKSRKPTLNSICLLIKALVEH